MPQVEFDVVVIGAGAAGMMCAATAGRRGRKVALVEHSAIVGEKIRISGGGRCNFTNVHCTPANFLSRNPDFCRSALARYKPSDFIALVDRYGIAWHEKKLGQLFCDGPSTQIVAMLREECSAAGVEWRIPCRVTNVSPTPGDVPGFLVGTDGGDIAARSLVIATGGLSVPKIGATPFGYRIAEQFGIGVVAPRPALVPLSLDRLVLQALGDLSGVSVDAEVSCDGGRFRENVLFTHRGLSGPAILQISSYWEGGRSVSLDLLPGWDVEALFANAPRSALPVTVMGEVLPRRFAQRWCEMHAYVQPLGTMAAKAVREMTETLSAWHLKPSGTLGYNKAEVTLGGVDTAFLSSKTMEAHSVPGLYFIGEVVDVTGHLGGFNFQWAWASGHAAGMAA